MFRLIIPFLILCSCAEPLPIIVYDEREAHHSPELKLPTEVLDACDIWQVECEAKDDDIGSYGNLIIEIFEGGASIDQSGRNFLKGVCRKSFWSKEASLYLHGEAYDAPLEYVIAHEMGHAFGLGSGHSTDPNNLMYPVPGKNVSEDQIDRVQRKMDFFVQCIP